MRNIVAKRIRKQLPKAAPGVIRAAKKEHVRKRGRQNPKPKLSKRQERLATKNI